jgi:hypothetical protein
LCGEEKDWGRGRLNKETLTDRRRVLYQIDDVAVAARKEQQHIAIAAGHA